jgi:hypothetical protein
MRFSGNAKNRKPDFGNFAALLVLLCVYAVATAQTSMGDPSVGPTKITNQDLDPTRNIKTPVLESTIHTPLSEEYIWTKEDAVPEHPTKNGWKPVAKNMGPHYFRRTFNLVSVPPHATLYLSGFSSAIVYLNGQSIATDEPDPDSEISTRVYAHDVTGTLRAGKNVLAIEAVRGSDVGNSANTRIGIQQDRGEALVAKIIPADRGIMAPALLITDAQWKATLHAATNWQDLSFDDSAWPNADSLGGIESSIDFFQWNADTGLYDWPGYDGISPFLERYHLAPMKISHDYNGIGQLTNVDALTSHSGAEFTAELPRPAPVLDDTPRLLLDFGREVTGRIELQSSSDQSAEVTVQYGESEAEATEGPYLGINPIYIPPHATVYGPKGAFRYALIHFTAGKSTTYKSIQLDGIAYPVDYKGSFLSSDPELNQMWTLGAYTAHLCMQDDIWDAPKRDRGRWMGDLEVSGRTIEDTFGDTFLMDETLEHLLGEAPIYRDVNGIPGYSAFWIIGETQYYKHTGSMRQLQSMHIRLVQLLEYMETVLNQDSLYVNSNHAWPFVDWSPELSQDGPESRRGTQFEFYAAFRDGAWLLRQLNDNTNADRFEKRAAAIKAAAQSSMLDASDSFGSRWQTNAYAVLSGVANPSQYPAIWRNALSSVGHIKYNGLIITPYYNYYVISAMAKMGHRAEALNWIRQYWGSMTQEGATSYWEGYDPSWYKGSDFHRSLQADDMSGFSVSLAHGWSSGVTPWLMEEILGIHATGPGFSTVNIRPDLIDLQWAKGAEPTPRGLLGVAIIKDKTTIDLPPGTIARISIRLPDKNARITVNGKPQSSTPDENGVRGAITLTQAGHYEIQTH